jgi:hypothetical protein
VERVTDTLQLIAGELRGADGTEVLVVPAGPGAAERAERHARDGGRVILELPPTRDGGAPPPLDGGLVVGGRGGTGGFVVAGVPAADLVAALGRAALALQGRVDALEEANDALAVANGRLETGRLGRTGGAAAGVALRLQGRIDVLEYERDRWNEERERLQATIGEQERTIAFERARVWEMEAVARRNDELYQQELAWRDAPRYHAVDAVRDAVLAVPGLASGMRGAWRLLSRAIPRR